MRLFIAFFVFALQRVFLTEGEGVNRFSRLVGASNDF